MSRFKAALEAIQRGEVVILIDDDEDLAGTGTLVLSAEQVTGGHVNFLLTHAGGFVHLAAAPALLARLALPPIPSSRDLDTADERTVSIDLDIPGGTGIGAEERARCIRHVLDPMMRPEDFRVPGHVFPVRCREGGVLRRAGHPEAAVDLVHLAGHQPAAVLTTILRADGALAAADYVRELAERHGLVTITIADIIRQRLRTEQLVRRVAEADLPTRYGAFRVIVYETTVDSALHVGLVRGEFFGSGEALVRVQTECPAADLFGSRSCGCHGRLQRALARIGGQPEGVLLYLRSTTARRHGPLHGLGIGSISHAPVVPEARADMREYGIGAQILRDLGLRRLRLLSDTAQVRTGLRGFGLEIIDQVPFEVPTNGM